MNEELNVSNPIKGLIISVFLGVVSTVLWVIVVKLTGYNLGIAAIGVGVIVSQGFVWGGKGTSAVWGIVAATIAGLSIFLGNAISVMSLVAEYYDIALIELSRVIYFEQLFVFMVDTFEVYDIVFYAIALQTAYKRSFVKESVDYSEYFPPKAEELTERT